MQGQPVCVGISVWQWASLEEAASEAWQRVESTEMEDGGRGFQAGHCWQRCAGRYTERMWKRVSVPSRWRAGWVGRAGARWGLATRKEAWSTGPGVWTLVLGALGNTEDLKGSLGRRVGGAGFREWYPQSLNLVMEGVGEQE